MRAARQKLLDLNQRLERGRITPDDWAEEFYQVVYDGHLQAAALGQSRAGLKQLDLNALKAIARQKADEESEFIQGFKGALNAKDARYHDPETGALRPGSMESRTDLYVGKMRGTANEQFGEASPAESRWTWRLGAVEKHCPDCPRLAAIIKDRPWSEVFEYPGQGGTACLGHCDCRLVRSDGVEGFANTGAHVGPKPDEGSDGADVSPAQPKLPGIVPVQKGPPGVPPIVPPVAGGGEEESQRDVLARTWKRLSPDADDVTRRLFEDPVEIEYEDEVMDAVSEIMGFKVTPAVLADVIGAPGGSTVSMQHASHGRVALEVSHPLVVVMEPTVEKSRGSWAVHNDKLILVSKARKSGIGSRIFAKQVTTARVFGAVRIETFAARGGAFPNGYVVWPSLGYDGDIPEWVLPKLPPNLKGARTLQQLFVLSGGREWWTKNGTGFNAHFDLSFTSWSTKFLEAVIDRKMIKFDIGKGDGEGLTEGSVVITPEDEKFIDEVIAPMGLEWFRVNEPETYRRLTGNA